MDYRRRATKKRQQRSSTNPHQQNSHSPVSPVNTVNAQGAAFQPRARPYHLAIAVPGSILGQSQSVELQTYLVGQIARCAAIYCVDEIIVYRDVPLESETGNRMMVDSVDNQPPSEINEELFVSFSDIPSSSHAQQNSPMSSNNSNSIDYDVLMKRILEYMECPPYLRKSLFPHHKDLRYAGLLNPLESPHHLRRNEWFPYREGVVVSGRQSASASGKQNGEEAVVNSNWVDCGWPEPVRISQQLPINTRVTLAMSKTTQPTLTGERTHITGKCVSPHQPRLDGYYWGYRVRLANNFRSIFSECPFESGYDITIGTSEHGHSIWDDVPSVESWMSENNSNASSNDPNDKLGKMKKVLMVFGGAQGIELALENDVTIQDAGVQAADCFDFWVNTCPGQGSRMIRTEEAMLVSMSWLVRWLENSKELVGGAEKDAAVVEDLPGH